jgi:hypothetical protein
MSVVPYQSPAVDLPARGLGRSIALLPGVVQLAEQIANTEFVKKGLRGNVPAISAAILSGDEIGFGPMQSLKYISVIDGQPSVSAEGQRALILAAGHSLKGVGTITKFTWTGRRADTGDAMEFTWTTDDAKRAGVAGRQAWRTYPRAMLSARASAELARALFPDVIGGLAATEELEDNGANPAGTDPEPSLEPAAESKTTRRRRSPPPTAPPPVVAPLPPPPDGPPEPPLPDEAPEPPAGVTQPQLRKLMAMFNERGMADRDDRLDWTNRHLDRTVISASELTAAEASALIDALEGTSTEFDDPAEASAWIDAAELPLENPDDSDDPPVSADRIDIITHLRREAKVSDAWMRAKLGELGYTDLPARISREHLRRLTRSEAMVLSDALSTVVDQNAARED